MKSLSSVLPLAVLKLKNDTKVQEGVVGKEKLQRQLTGLKASIHHHITPLEKHSERWGDRVTDWWCDLHVNVFGMEFAFPYSTVFSIFCHWHLWMLMSAQSDLESKTNLGRIRITSSTVLLYMLKSGQEEHSYLLCWLWTLADASWAPRLRLVRRWPCIAADMRLACWGWWNGTRCTGSSLHSPTMTPHSPANSLSFRSPFLQRPLWDKNERE